jgi:hypothetical protein
MKITKKNNSYHLHLVIDQHDNLIVVDDRKHDYHDVIDCATTVVYPVKVEVPE